MSERETRDLNADDLNELKGESFSVPGYKVDRFGNKFALPVGDDETLFDSNPLEWPNREQLEKEGWYTYFETDENIGVAMGRGFRPVSREEAGFALIDGTVETEYGKPEHLAQPHKVGNMTLLKAPQEVYNAIDKARQKVARQATHPILHGAKQKKQEFNTGQGNVVTEDDIRPAFTVQETKPAAGQR